MNLVNETLAEDINLPQTDFGGPQIAAQKCMIMNVYITEIGIKINQNSTKKNMLNFKLYNQIVKFYENILNLLQFLKYLPQTLSGCFLMSALNYIGLLAIPHCTLAIVHPQLPQQILTDTHCLPIGNGKA